MTVEQIIGEIEELVSTAFNDGVGVGHPMSRSWESRERRNEHRERIAELRTMLEQLIRESV